MPRLTLAFDVAVVFDDWLRGFEKQPESAYRDQAEQRALWNFLCLFEEVLVLPLDQRWHEFIPAARTRLRAPEVVPPPTGETTEIEPTDDEAIVFLAWLRRWLAEPPPPKRDLADQRAAEQFADALAAALGPTSDGALAAAWDRLRDATE